MKSLILRVVPTLIFYSGFVQYFNLIAILYHDFQRSQVLHFASIANDAGVAHNTARAWISVLEASYILSTAFAHTTKISPSD
jgi:hypothetical protein